MRLKKYQETDLQRKMFYNIENGEIHIWTLRWRKIIKLIWEYQNYLPKNIKQKIKKYRTYEDKMRCSTGEIVSRVLLSRYLNTDINDIEIYREKYGKPSCKPIEGKKHIFFNVSHSREYVLLAFSLDGEIGVDIEYISPIIGVQEIIADYCFLDEEVDEIRKDSTFKAFYMYWTRLEAFLKATGYGLYGVESYFEFHKSYFSKDMKAHIFPCLIQKEYVSHIAILN